ncbi:phage tail protein [Rhizobium skierniewicense]|uniref:phage tail protein n=1 Tax=Rhizobium skierniewicense TaxID=984260 RepID=UPI001FADB973|nr:phage tail protein [Rhizobium skierniewicense]MCI9864873.1 phage tail protein [Rhizobium skierniewicense]
MSLKRVLWLLWFFLIFVDVAQAAPAIGAIIAAAKAIFTVAAIVKLAIGAAINIGLSMYQRAKARKDAKKNQQQSSGVTLSIQMGESLSRSYLIGTVATAGRRAYINSWGSESNTPNAYVTEVIEISCLPSFAGPQGLESAWFGDTLGTILWGQPHPDGRGYPVEQYRRSGTDYLWVKYLDGSQTAADPFLLSRFANRTERPYKDTMIGRGCQIVILTARRHEELFRNGFPQGLYQPKPMRLYDLRKDSSQGGNGAHRWGDTSTYEASDNLAQMIYNVARGMYYNGRWVHGGRNFSAFRFPVSSWIAALNEADRDMGNGRRQFRGGMEVFVERDGLDVIEDFRLGSNARLAEVGGRIKILAGAPGAAVYSFTDSEIVITADQSLEPFPTIAATHNTITGVYPEPAQRWTDKDAPEQTSQALIDRDGGERLAVSLRFDAVPFSAQVQSLTSTMIMEEQRWRIHDLVLPPNAAALEPNDVVAFSSEENSYANKKFLIDRAVALPGRLQRVIIKEIDPSDYDPPSIIVPPVIGWMGPVTEPPQPMYGWTVAPAVISNASNTSQRPSIKVGCAPDQDGVERVWVKVRRASDKAIVFDSDSTRYGAPFEWVLNGTFTPNTDYEVAGEYVSYINRNQEQSSWLPVRTPNVLISTSDVFDNAITATKIADAAVSAEKLMNEAVTSLKLADQAVSTAKLQVGAVTAEIIANKAVDITKFASGLEPVSIVASGALPTVKTTTNITWQGDLYTWNGTAYAKPEAGVADGSITAAKLANAAVTADKLANSAVTHDKIVAGAVYGDVIAAQSITARELILTDFNNIVDNGWQKGIFSGWTLYNPPNIIATYRDQNIPVRPSDGWLLRTNGRDCAMSAYVAVSPGEAFNVSTWVYNTDPAIAWLVLACGDATGTITQFAFSVSTSLKDQWVNLSGNAIIPAGTVTARLYMYVDKTAANGNNSFWSKPTMRRAANAQLIVDGSIIATKIATGAITADAIAANAITTAKIMAGAVSAAQIAAGAITTEKLAVGLGKNWLSNSDFSAGMQGWGVEYVNSGAGTWNVQMRTDNYGVNPYGSLQLNYKGTDPNVVVGAWQLDTGGSAKAFACVPGQWLEMSGRFYGHRTTVLQCYLQFIDAAGTLVQYALPGVFGAQQNGNPDYKLGNYLPFFCKVQVPAGATQVRPFWRMGGVVNGQQDAYLWLKNLFFGLATANQTEASQWSDGGITVIGPGNIATGAILADKIGALAVTAGKIAANAVTATEIAANAVTAAKIMAASITGDKVVANSITSRELILTDFTNLIPNGDFVSGDLATTLDIRKNQASDTIVFLPGQFALNGNRSLLIQKTVSSGIVHAVSAYMPGGNSFIPVEGGASYAVETSVWSNTGNAAAGFYVVIDWYDMNKNFISGISAINNVGVFFDRVNRKGKVTAPAGARFAKVALYNNDQNTTTDNFIVDYIYMRKANAASLIVEGSITAAHIAANSITADKLQVTSLAAITATLGNVNIENAIVGNLKLGDANLEPGSIARLRTVLTSSNNAPVFFDVDLVVDHGSRIKPNVPVLVRLEYVATGKLNIGNQVLVGPHYIRDVTGGGNTVIYQSNPNTALAGDAFRDYTTFRTYAVPDNRSSSTFRLQLPSSGYGNWSAVEFSGTSFRNNE